MQTACQFLGVCLMGVFLDMGGAVGPGAGRVPRTRLRHVFRRRLVRSAVHIHQRERKRKLYRLLLAGNGSAFLRSTRSQNLCSQLAKQRNQNYYNYRYCFGVRRNYFRKGQI